MFWTIPSSKSEIQTNTPLGIKSIRSIFFENKNGGLFDYKAIPDAITISIDGKVVCRDLFMLPFCTTSPDCLNRFQWQDVAININLNVNNSEVKISGLRTNDFNIVFVCSLESTNEKGFDFFETKFLALKREQSNNNIVGRAPSIGGTIIGRPSIGGSISSVIPNIIISRPISVTNVDLGKEMGLSFDYAPEFMFCYPFVSDINNKIKTQRLYANFDVSNAESEIFPDRTDLAVIAANEKLSYRDVIFYFDERQNKKDLKLTIRMNQPNVLANDSTILNCDAAFLFGYKKIN